MKDIPSMNFFSNNSLLTIQIIEKAQENLKCEVSDTLSISLLTTTRFCDENMFNYSDSQTGKFDPTTPCFQYSSFIISKLDLPLSIKLLIIILSVIFGLCFFLIIGYFIRRCYKNNKRFKAYLEENKENLVLDQEETVKIEILARENPIKNEGLLNDSTPYKGNSPVFSTARGFLCKTLEIESEKKTGKAKSQLETSRIGLKTSENLLAAPEKTEENRDGGEDIAEESKSQEAKIIFDKKNMP